MSKRFLTSISLSGTITASGDITGSRLLSSSSAANEGGEIVLALPSSGSTLSTSVTIDIYQNKLRFFETGGTNRGYYIDLTGGSATVGSNLVGGGSASNSFTTISTPSGTSPAASSSTDTLTLSAGTYLTITGNSSTKTVTFATNATSSNTVSTLVARDSSGNFTAGTITGDIVASTNNGNGTNFKVGDDAWIGDFNVANSIRIKGQQNSANGYIVFGDSDSKALGRAGTGALTYDGNVVWHAGNDGSGSGLDADLLDGLSSGDFARINSANTFTVSNTLRAGTATAGTAPLYFQSGTNLTTAVAGAVEYDGSKLYFTVGTPSVSRRAVAFTDTGGTTLDSAITASSLTSVGTLANLTVTNTITGSISGNAGTVTNGVYTTGSYSNPSWITGLAWSKISSTPTTLSGYGITDAATSTHTHGNITNSGAIGSTSGLVVVTTTSGALTTLAAGSAGQFLQYNGTWATPTASAVDDPYTVSFLLMGG